ncbi:hypothetical protein BKA62DRAFT_412410 [Auriculariales sp. MPI-PUGE-AT-0066]|nr:hypothetical protein BKA62DRAFT_412410 [Auriculariales sp. MPI-PUGE-AT-0066]
MPRNGRAATFTSPFDDSLPSFNLFASLPPLPPSRLIPRRLQELNDLAPHWPLCNTSFPVVPPTCTSISASAFCICCLTQLLVPVSQLYGPKLASTILDSTITAHIHILIAAIPPSPSLYFVYSTSLYFASRLEPSVHRPLLHLGHQTPSHPAPFAICITLLMLRLVPPRLWFSLGAVAYFIA